MLCKVCKRIDCVCRAKKVYKGPARVSKKQQAKNKEKAQVLEQDKVIYKEILTERGNICENCDNTFTPSLLNFHHLLEKRNYQEIRHEHYNIMVLCADCHSGTETRPDLYPKILARRNEALKRYSATLLPRTTTI